MYISSLIGNLGYKSLSDLSERRRRRKIGSRRKKLAPAEFGGKNRISGVPSLTAKFDGGPWTVKRIEISDGDAGIRQSVAEMQRLARRDAHDPQVRRIAEGLQRSNAMATMQASFDYVVDRIPYKNDPDEYELTIAPRYTLTGKAKNAGWDGGDCDDLCMALAALLTAQGMKCWYRIIAWRSQDFTHVNLRCQPRGSQRVFALDPVMKAGGFGQEKQPVIREEFYGV